MSTADEREIFRCMSNIGVVPILSIALLRKIGCADENKTIAIFTTLSILGPAAFGAIWGRYHFCY